MGCDFSKAKNQNNNGLMVSNQGGDGRPISVNVVTPEGIKERKKGNEMETTLKNISASSSATTIIREGNDSPALPTVNETGVRPSSQKRSSFPSLTPVVINDHEKLFDSTQQDEEEKQNNNATSTASASDPASQQQQQQQRLQSDRMSQSSSFSLTAGIHSPSVSFNGIQLPTPTASALNHASSFHQDGSPRLVKKKLTRPSMVRSRLETLIVSPYENHALVFIKPHAAGILKVKEFVENFLQDHKCYITAEGELLARDIEEKGIIDKHYSAIATNAMKVLPKDLFITDEKKKEFNEKFGESWDELNANESIFNIKTLQNKFPEITAQEIDDAWTHQSTVKVKLGPGNYVGKLVQLDKYVSPLYLVNGFYSSMRELYVSKGAKVVYFTVEWEENDLSWADFRSKVIGSTDPKEADPNSLRGRLYKEYKRFGLAEEPDKGKNCVHASAGPVEAMKERITWLEMDLNDDPFARAMKSKGVSEELIKSWSDNEACKIGTRQGPAFDLLEDLNSSTVIDLAIETEKKQDRKESTMTPKIPVDL